MKIMLSVRILLVLGSITVLFLRGEAAEAVCDQRFPFPTIKSLLGVPGTNRTPGVPGTQGETGVDGAPGSNLEDVLRLLLCKGISESVPATSCKEIHDCNPNSPSGYYWINTTTGPLQVYCQIETNNCGNITGGWMRAAYIDMTNDNNTCPQGLTYTVVNSTRMCTRSQFNAGCTSVTFPTHGVPYTKVCGRAIAYERGSTDAFMNYDSYSQRSLDDYYIDGLSVTHGDPRSHIWTFAAGLSKGNNYPHNDCCNCPCALYPGPAAPPFVGEDYFCESGISGNHQFGLWYFDDPLWDTQGCATNSTCCDRGGPWFTTTLSQEVSDDIEVRMCLGEQSDFEEDVGVEQLEIYIY